MKKKILFIFAMSMLTVGVSACGNQVGQTSESQKITESEVQKEEKESQTESQMQETAVDNSQIEIDEAAFKGLKCERDEFEDTAVFYPEIDENSGYEVIEETYTGRDSINGGFKDKTIYYLDNIQSEASFTAFPVISYDKMADIPYRFDCVMRYKYADEQNIWGALSIKEMIILSNEKKYILKNFEPTYGLNVYDEASTISLSETGINMLKDISEQKENQVKIRMIAELGDTMDISVDKSVFDLVLQVWEQYSNANGDKQDLSEFDKNITVEE